MKITGIVLATTLLFILVASDVYAQLWKTAYGYTWEWHNHYDGDPSDRDFAVYFRYPHENQSKNFTIKIESTDFWVRRGLDLYAIQGKEIMVQNAGTDSTFQYIRVVLGETVMGFLLLFYDETYIAESLYFNYPLYGTRTCLQGPQVTVSPTSGPPGTIFTLQWSCFKPLSSLTSYLQKPDRTYFPPLSFPVSEQGTATHSINSTSLTAGVYTHWARDNWDGMTTPAIAFTVSQPTSAPSPAGGIVYGSYALGSQKISLFQESGRRLYFLGAASLCTSIEGYAFGGGAQNSGPIWGWLSGDRCYMDFSSSSIDPRNDTIYFRYATGDYIWVESPVGTRRGDLVVGQDRNVKIPASSGSTTPPPVTPPPSTQKSNFSIKQGSSASIRGYWGGGSTITLYDVANCSQHVLHVRGLAGLGPVGGFTGTAQGSNCVFSASIGFGANEIAFSINGASWYYFDGTGSCTQYTGRTEDGTGWLRLVIGCVPSANLYPRSGKSGPTTSQIQLYDLNGAPVYDSGPSAVKALNRYSELIKRLPLASGVYLYVVTVRGFDGQLIRNEVKKLVLLR